MQQQSIEFEGKQYVRPGNTAYVYLSEALARIGNAVKADKVEHSSYCGMLEITYNPIGPHCPEAEDYLGSIQYSDELVGPKLKRTQITRRDLMGILQRLGKPTDGLVKPTDGL